MEEIKAEEIDKILDELSEEIRIRDLEIRAEAYGTHFTNDYIINLRDAYNENNGRRECLEAIKGKLLELQENKKERK